MKFTVTMKDPDTLHDAIEEAVKENMKEMKEIDDEEKSLIVDKRKAEVNEICDKWFEYDEYLSVEIDTELKTCTVIEKK
jgi:hypothetical protein